MQAAVETAQLSAPSFLSCLSFTISRSGPESNQLLFLTFFDNCSARNQVEIANQQTKAANMRKSMQNIGNELFAANSHRKATLRFK